ncbi:MAG TPA: RdgB/HAM1 family non-canonical purine NTP pyrophosphatase [Acidimicrobiia bacterium]|jgi:XTP/dITP diphosphohydrolase
MIGREARLPFPFVLATGNSDKAREILEIFTEAVGELLAASAIDYAGRTCGYLVAPGATVATAVAALRPLDGQPDIEETGTTLEENARIKAEGMFVATGVTAIADDTGLEVDALGGAPGVWSARYAGEDATYADNVHKLLRELAGVPAAERTARFATVAHVAGGDLTLTVRGEVAGTIADAKRGAGTFGYDPVFVPDDSDGRTFAEMDASEKHALSHRGRAFRALVDAFGDLDI